MILFIKLFLAHILGDFILQSNQWVANKEKKQHKSPYLYIHAGLHGILPALFIFKKEFIPWAVFLALSHGVIDYLKIRFQNNRTARKWFWIDQSAHIIILIIIAIGYQSIPLSSFEFDSMVWLYLSAILFVTKPVSFIIKNAISVWTPDEAKKDDSLQNAGNYIGILERLFVFGMVVSGNFSAVGFLLAAKSIFRFGDLKESKDRKLTEYVLIGTLLSFGIAILTAVIVKYMALLL